MFILQLICVMIVVLWQNREVKKPEVVETYEEEYHRLEEHRRWREKQLRLEELRMIRLSENNIRSKPKRKRK